MRHIKEIMIVAVCLMVLSFCVCTGFGIYFMYREGVQEYEDLRTYVKETDEDDTQKEQTEAMRNRPWLILEH